MRRDDYPNPLRVAGMHSQKTNVMKKLLRVVIAVFLPVLCPNIPALADGRTQASQKITVPLPVDFYLSKLGQQLDCYFTIESKTRTDAEMNAMKANPALASVDISPLLRTDNVLSAPPITSVDEAVTQLKRALPQAEVFRDANAGNVVHIVDLTLVRQPDYVLNDIIDCSYAGVLGMLPDVIGKTYKNIGLRRGGDTSQFFGDWVTAVTVKAKGQIIREVLTDCVPRKGYSHLLWNAETNKTVSGALLTTVQYYGPTS